MRSDFSSKTFTSYYLDVKVVGQWAIEAHHVEVMYGILFILYFFVLLPRWCGDASTFTEHENL